MAIDVYLTIDGIKGESTDIDHKDYIECLSVGFGVLQPRSATASSAGGHTAERCEHQDIVVTKLTDIATPLLLEQCSMGKTIPKAKFDFMRADADGKRVKYFSIELENVLISSVTPHDRKSFNQVFESQVAVRSSEYQRWHKRQHGRWLGSFY
jgi:type VI secretion system secreted protein Hcp